MPLNGGLTFGHRTSGGTFELKIRKECMTMKTSILAITFFTQLMFTGVSASMSIDYFDINETMEGAELIIIAQIEEKIEQFVDGELCGVRYRIILDTHLKVRTIESFRK